MRWSPLLSPLSLCLSLLLISVYWRRDKSLFFRSSNGTVGKQDTRQVTGFQVILNLQGAMVTLAGKLIGVSGGTLNITPLITVVFCFPIVCILWLLTQGCVFWLQSQGSCDYSLRDLSCDYSIGDLSCYYNLDLSLINTNNYEIWSYRGNLGTSLYLEVWSPLITSPMTFYLKIY